MSEMNGFIVTNIQAGEREPRVHEGFIGTESIQFGTREKRTLLARMMPTLIAGERENKVFKGIVIKPISHSTGEKDIQTKELSGFLPWGDGNEKPRRTPLEISWRSKGRKI